MIAHAANEDDNDEGNGQHHVEHLAIEGFLQAVLENRQVFHGRRTPLDRPGRISSDRPGRGAGVSTPGSADFTICTKRSSRLTRFSLMCRTLKPLERSRSSTGSMVWPSLRLTCHLSPARVAL